MISVFCSAVLYDDPAYKIVANLDNVQTSVTIATCNKEIGDILTLKGYKGTPQMSDYLRLKYSEHSAMPEHVKTTTRSNEAILEAKKKLLKSILKCIMDELKFPVTDAGLDCYVVILTEDATQQELTWAHFLMALMNSMHLHEHNRPHHHDHGQAVIPQQVAPPSYQQAVVPQQEAPAPTHLQAVPVIPQQAAPAPAPAPPYSPPHVPGVRGTA